MKLDSSTLFVNTGRKPLPAMQKKKKNSKNTVALVVCIAIIAVLCVFVGLIVHVWLNYNEEISTPNTTEVTQKVENKVENVPPAEPDPQEEPKKETKTKVPNKTSGKKTAMSKAAEKAFSDFYGTYSFGIVNLNDGYTYISNTGKVENSAALGAFLLEYVSHGIYMGSFDYTTNVSGHTGSALMDRAFSQGSVEAANLLIEYFGVDKLNAYFKAQGYTNTKFESTIGSGVECYTTAKDLIKLMKKMYDNTTFFPYSDMYSKMRASSVDTKIAALLPEGVSIANIGFDTVEEVFDAAIVNTPDGDFIFVAMAEGSEDDTESAKSAISLAAKSICERISGASDKSE